MLGLIKKDIIMIKSNFKTLAIIFVVYAIMAYQGTMDLSFILPFMSVMIMISTFSYDEFNKWNAYACTLPNGRRNAVRAKYITTFLIIIASTLLVIVSSFAIRFMRGQDFNYKEVISTILGVFLATILIQSVMYPIIYKFGVEKARIGIFAGVFGIGIIGTLIAEIYDFGKLFELLESFENYIMFILPVMMLIILYISYKVSEIISLRKEF